MQHYTQLLQWLFTIAGQGAPGNTPSDVAIWVALIMGGSGVATGIVGLIGALAVNRRSSRHSTQIEKLQKQLDAVKSQLRRERLTWHWWARQVVAYLRTLPDGEHIADGLPPIPDSIRRSVVSRFRVKRRPRGDHDE